MRAVPLGPAGEVYQPSDMEQGTSREETDDYSEVGAALPRSVLGDPGDREAQCQVLELETGWRWDVSELGHFRTRPKSFPPDVLRWRRELVLSASHGSVTSLSHLAGRAPVES